MNENTLYLAGLIDEDGKPLVENFRNTDRDPRQPIRSERDPEVEAMPILQSVQAALQSGELSQAGFSYLMKGLTTLKPQIQGNM